MLYDVARPRRGGLGGLDYEATGIPSEPDFVRRYSELTGRGGEAPANFTYHKAFSLFRLAAIAQGVYKRSLDGNASSPDAVMYGEAVKLLADIACKLAGA
jgi:aminoglycoside phosphotransferase (APT) family kinase protein